MDDMYLYQRNFVDARKFSAFKAILVTLPMIRWRIRIDRKHDKAHGHIRLMDRYGKGRWLHDDPLTLAVAIKVIHYHDWTSVPRSLLAEIDRDHRTITDATANALVVDARSVARTRSSPRIPVHRSKRFLLACQSR